MFESLVLAFMNVFLPTNEECRTVSIVTKIEIQPFQEHFQISWRVENLLKIVCELVRSIWNRNKE